MFSILVVEGDEAHALLLQTILEKYAQVIICLQGQQISELLQKSEFDLVIMSLRFQGIDTWSMMEKIRSRTSAPILVVTAYVDEQSKKRAFEMGCNAYLTKPYKIAELTTLVKSLLTLE